ncbi:MAG: glucosaminidase domain-containing protein [Gluconacetobacter diazotrophicus]|nr:glucosaminidase domain-containing protein [Gluconacetobacter diazotrophicus]
MPVSITLAQACIESGWGQHHIGSANNYFGIKAPMIHGIRSLGTIAIGFVEVSTNEYDSHHQLYTIVDTFRRYLSMTDSFRDHGLWVRDNRRYPGAIAAYRQSGDADAFALALQAGGYAGLHNIVYAGSLLSMMKRHAFYQYNAARKP